MEILHAHRPVSLSGLDDFPLPSVDAARVRDLLGRCPVADQTPLVSVEAIAVEAAVAQVWVKDERGRMGLGSFKALGAAYVIARDAENGQAAGKTYVTASAGNHGMSVAAGAAAFGARAVIHVAETVPDSFADRLREQGAEVVRSGAIYEEAQDAARAAADDNGWTLLSDSSEEGYVDLPWLVMEGYLVLMAETVDHMPTRPTHIFLQAGVGGLAAACAAYARTHWGNAPRIVVVEPDAAPALHGSIRSGKAVTTSGPVSAMGRLDCKTPSLIALKGLARDADDYVLITEGEAQAGAGTAMVAGLASTPSGAAGIAALLAAGDEDREVLGLAPTSVVLCIVSEGPEA